MARKTKPTPAYSIIVLRLVPGTPAAEAGGRMRAEVPPQIQVVANFHERSHYELAELPKDGSDYVVIETDHGGGTDTHGLPKDGFKVLDKYRLDPAPPPPAEPSRDSFGT
jgi:hypothetical protein